MKYFICKIKCNGIDCETAEEELDCTLGGIDNKKVCLIHTDPVASNGFSLHCLKSLPDEYKPISKSQLLLLAGKTKHEWLRGILKRELKKLLSAK